LVQDKANQKAAFIARLEKEWVASGRTRVRIVAQELALLCDRSLTLEGTELPVVLGVHMPYHDINPGRLARSFAPLLNYLQTNLVTRTGTRALFGLQVFNSPSNAIRGLLEGQVDVLRPDPAFYVLARQKDKNMTPIVRQVYAGGPDLRGAIFTRAESDITRLEDLKGRPFAFGDRESVVGDYLPKAELVAAGLHARDFQRTAHLSRATLVSDVNAGRFAAGAADLGDMVRFTNAGVRLRMLKEFRSPNWPWVVTPKLDPSIAAGIREHLMALRDPDTLAAVDPQLTGFAPAQPSDYDALERQIEQSKQFDATP